MVILVIMNQKGGVGKTTTAVTTAFGMARAGCRTLLIDLDGQGNVATCLGMEKREGLQRLIMDDDPEGAIVRTRQAFLSVVLGDHSTVRVKRHIELSNFRERILRSALDTIEGYDLCVLDVAPGIDVLQVNAVMAATHILMPVSLEALAVAGAVDALGSIATLREMPEYRARFLGVLPTFWDRRKKETDRQYGALVESFGTSVWPAIPTDVKAAEAPGYGQTLWEYAPRCRALSGIWLKDRMVGGYARVLERLMSEAF